MNETTSVTEPAHAAVATAATAVAPGLAGATLVLGLGASGLAMARWAGRDGAEVRVWDSREIPPAAADLLAALPNALRLPARALTEGDLAGVARVLKSPGLAPHDPAIAELLTAARARGLVVGAELDCFHAALDELRAALDYQPQVIAVTGTNGKTTTTALTAKLVEAAGRRVAVAGNIGPTMLQTLADAVATGDAVDAATLRDRLPQVWVLELSSFQLADAGRVDVDAAALLNVTEDHLDWHGDMAAYAAAKARIFGDRAALVVDRDDAVVQALLPAPKTVAPTRKGRPAKTVERRVVSFGASAPSRIGDFGLIEQAGMWWLAHVVDDEGATELGHLVKALMPADALRIRGRHNALNALAALALASAVGCPLAPMLHALREYRGEPHRVEPVLRVDDVEFYDDSKGTNVGATVAALEGLGVERAPSKLVCILGGDGKGQDFAPLRAPLQRHARAVVAIGRDGAAIGAVATEAGVPVEAAATLEAATQRAFELARPGDAVLLSPACASLDMFRHYVHRAEVFVAAAEAIAAERGHG